MRFERKTTLTIGANTKPMDVIVNVDSKGYPMGSELPDARCSQDDGCDSSSVYLTNWAYNETFSESGYIVRCSNGCEGLTWNGSKTIVWHPWNANKMVVAA